MEHLDAHVECRQLAVERDACAGAGLAQHHRVGQQVFGAQARRLRPRMIERRDEHQQIVRKMLVFNPAAGHSQAAHGQIHLARAQPFQRVLARAHVAGHVHARIVVAEARHDLGQHVLARGGAAPDRQVSHQLSLVSGDAFLQPLRFAQQVAHHRHQRLAHLIQVNVAPRPVEQLGMQPVLQGLNLRADGRLRDLQDPPCF